MNAERAHDGWARFADWLGAPGDEALVPCHAPFVAMAFQTDGTVMSCCRKPSTRLGDVRAQGLREIWRGPQARELRALMSRREFPTACGVCRDFALGGNPTLADVRKYRAHADHDPDPAWPKRLELNLSNRCNLECVHCSGELSSAIRSREGRPPLPAVYGDAFFEQLEEFYPHLDAIVFLGGEPFLQGECLRIFDALIAGGHRVFCHVTTNGTVFGARIARIVESLPMRVSISIDGALPTTLERIRRGARHEVIERNAREFARLGARNGMGLGFAFTPMRSNWAEFGLVCRWADELGATLSLNTLIGPAQESLFLMPPDDLGPIVASLERELARQTSLSTPNRERFETFVRDLARHHQNRIDEVAMQQTEARRRSEIADAVAAAAELRDRGDISGAARRLDQAPAIAADDPPELVAHLASLRTFLALDLGDPQIHGRIDAWLALPRATAQHRVDQAHVLRRIGRVEQARQLLAECTDARELATRTLVELAWCEAELGHGADALRLATAAAGLPGGADSLAVVHAQGFAASRAADLAALRSCIERATRMPGGDGVAFHLRSLLAHEDCSAEPTSGALR